MKKDQTKTTSGRAADRRHQTLLAEILTPAVIDVCQQLHINNGMCGLEWGCGAGHITWHLKELVGAEGAITGIDQDDTTVAITRQRAEEHGLARVTFLGAAELDTMPTRDFDFAVAHLFNSPHADPITILSSMVARLRSGGTVAATRLASTNGASFPYSYAFERCRELLAKLDRREDLKNVDDHTLLDIAEKSGLEHIRTRFSPPVFLTGDGKRLTSLAFESAMTELLTENLITADEGFALLTELKDFENQEHSMISIPAVHQVWGIKA